jgi:hypothetical protein
VAISPSGVLAFPLPPAVVVPPVSQTVVAGESVVFNVTATGMQPINYQWYFNNAATAPSSTNSAFTLANISTNQTGAYSVLLTNVYGSVTSAVANLVVVPPPSIVLLTSTNGFSLTAMTAQEITYSIQQTTNLAPPVIWQRVATNTTGTNGLIQFAATNTAGPSVFYRVEFP